MPLDSDEYGVQFETDVEYITNYFEALSDIRDEGLLVCDGESLFTKVQDPSNVALAISKIQGSGLGSMDHQADGLVKEGLNFEKAEGFFDGVSKTNSVIISYPVERNNAYYMHIDIVEEDVQFTCPLVGENSVPQPPDMDPIVCDTQVNIPGDDFKKAIKHCLKVKTEQNNGAYLTTGNDEFTIWTEDQVEGSVEKTFTASGPESQSMMKNKQTGISLQYLDDIKKTIGKSDEVTIHIDDEYPVRIDANLDDVGDAKIIYVIAPRIKDEG